MKSLSHTGWLLSALLSFDVSAGVSAGMTAGATDARRVAPGFAGIDAQPYIRSVSALRFQGVVKQQKDYSCGAAALSTLLTHHYGDPVTEADILRTVTQGDAASRIRAQGLSMLDMKSFLESRGYAADGYRMAPDALLAKAKVPAVALINVQGYRHFVVIKGLQDKTLLIGDPARGLRRVSLDDFRAMAGEALLLVKSHATQGRRSFNRAQDWRAMPAAPLGSETVRPFRNGLPLDMPVPSPF
jgi:predicted double-glycine peptidase